MSEPAPWIALSVDWMDSEMFDDSNYGERLAWICLLCHAKSAGRGGVVRVRDRAFAQRYRLSPEAVESMLGRASESGAITRQGDTVTLRNWSIYQYGKKKPGGASARGDPCKKRGSTQSPKNTPTHHTSQDRTNHRKPPVSPPRGASANGTRSNRRQSACTPSQAESIYALYPRKQGKRAAVKAIQQAAARLVESGNDDPLAHLQRQTIAYANSPAGQPPPEGGEDFRPHPATWFNQDRFDDDPETWKRRNGVKASKPEKTLDEKVKDWL